MQIELPYKIDAQRRLCIKKDLIELSQWIDALTNFNAEMDYFAIIVKQLIKDQRMSTNLQSLRRKNTLLLALLCKYEQALKTEYEYGKQEYDITRAKEHEKKRDSYADFIGEFTQYKSRVYNRLAQFQRR